MLALFIIRIGVNFFLVDFLSFPCEGKIMEAHVRC